MVVETLLPTTCLLAFGVEEEERRFVVLTVVLFVAAHAASVGLLLRIILSLSLSLLYSIQH